MYSSVTGRYLYITPEYKVINPAHLGTIYRYEGLIEGVDLKNQNNNLLKIQNILMKLDMPLTKIYIGKMIGDKSIKTSFIAHSENGRFWWRKYEDSSNYMYDNGIRIKLHKFLDNFSGV
jgi:hypothetical protein